MKYNVITAGDYASFIKKVNEVIGQGWKPQGGVSIHSVPNVKPGPAAVFG